VWGRNLSSKLGVLASIFHCCIQQVRGGKSQRFSLSNDI
jgi:hypothetical protein